MTRAPFATAVLLSLACSGADPAPEVEWPRWAADDASTHYAAIGDVDASSFATLEVAWRWQSADVAWKARTDGSRVERGIRKAAILTQFQGTPLMVDGVLYGATSIGQVFALDAATGRERWVHDPETYRHATPGSFEFVFPKHRGVAYWEEGGAGRVLLPTIDAFLLALDAETGEPIASFGEGGRVDLLRGLRREGLRRVGDYFQSSPPIVVGDVVVVGSSIDDRPRGQDQVPGDVRGYDVRTGELRWTFHVVPAEGELGTDTWEEESWRHTGGANVWGPMSADPELGTVYLATSTPTNDFYGGHRLGDNLFAESIVCLDAETGERVWHFQVVHHGLWDYDLGAAPNLVDLVVAGQPVRALAQVTKQGLTFVLDRATGEPVFPIEERPVPASDVPGERASATQPFPTRPPPFERQGVAEGDLIDFTPELHAEALAIFRRHRAGPVFTPPSLHGTLTLPGSGGGANWQGAGFDPETGVLFVPSITVPSIVSVKKSEVDQPKPDDGGFRYVLDAAPPAVVGERRTPDALPLLKPPYSRITAIDLAAGEILWQRANGDGPRDHPRLAHLGLPELGSGVPTCVLVTSSLLFAGDGAGTWLSKAGEPIFRAYDKATGRLVGERATPARVRGCPMTYRHGGRQFIVLPVSDVEHAPELVALALPEA